MDEQEQSWQSRMAEWVKNNPKTMPDELQRLREQFVERFPRERLSNLTLEEYALKDRNPNTFCYWLEYATAPLGSAKGGAASKWGVWWGRKEKRWLYRQHYKTRKGALSTVTKSLTQLTDAAAKGRFEQLDEISRRELGFKSSALIGKVLYLYFPDDFLPITSLENMKYFLSRFSQQHDARGSVATNRQLLQLLRSKPEFDGFDTQQMTHFLYSAWPPPPRGRGKDDDDDEADDMISVEQDSLLAPTPQPLSPELQRLLELTTYTSNLILYGPPGTGKTWRVRALGKHLAASQPATTTNAGAGVGQPLRAWMLITNDDWVLDDGQKWKWADFLTSGTEFFSTRRRFASAFEQASDNDLVFCYRATPVKKLVAVAKVVQQYHEEDEEMGVTIGQISPLTNPIPWATLSSRLQLRSNDVQATFRPLSEEQTAGLVQLCREAGNDLTLPTTEAEEDALLNLTQATEAHSNVEFVTFHQSFAYEDFVEGLKPQIRGGQLDYVVEPGVFRRICTAAEAHPDEHYLLVIDEINRANIAKVFGELITLIEDDKRLTWNPDAGRWEGMRVQLPYSKQQFGVPDNLLLVGTMNTADRSIALLDIALRRRFAFALVPPEPTLLKPLALTEGSLDLSQLLSVLNERVAALLDDDHRIGHSYLMRIGSLAGLRFAWYQRIIPLLEEYFYHDGERLRKVLGGAFVTQTKLSEAAKKALGDLADSSFRRYEVKREMRDADFLGALQRLAANTQVGEGAGEMSED